MKHVDLHSDWGTYELLDGSPLKNGEPLKIKFPDGKILEANVVIQHTGITDYSFGGTISDDEAFINIEIFGISLPVSLRKHAKELLCERI